jgi:hypothetical protein
MALKLATLTLRREGQFYQLVGGEHHCGAKAQLVSVRVNGDVTTRHKGPEAAMAIPVNYALTVACGPTLDHRGFLFDQAMVDKWFQRKGQAVSSLSCEALTIALANQLMDKLARDAAHCELRGVTLQLSPAPHKASLSAHFVRE